MTNIVQQNGNGNTAVTYQTGGMLAGSSFILHRSLITQTGDNNFASLSQSGPNGSLIEQRGNDNIAAVTQSYAGPGNPNTAYIRQIGNGFSASITQHGAGNSAGVYQHY
jgi:hypothetical protein